MPWRTGRVGGVFLGGFGLVLGLLMAYSLLFEGAGATASGRDPDGAVEIPVLFLERGEWRIFARGVRACAESRRGLGQLIDEDEDSLLVETSRQKRQVRFTWHGLRGEGQARDEVRSLLSTDRPPIAVVGSSNTVLTVAMAAQLRKEAERRPGGGPLLFVPWATSISLLDLYPGRTFRFCSNNRHEAEMLIDCLKSQSPGDGPRRVVMVVDRVDPYSVDLAASLRREIAHAFPSAEVVEPAGDVPASPGGGPSSLPNAAEQAKARAIWRDVVDGPGGETWVVLPLQNEPARRMLTSLNAAAPGRHDAKARPVSVLCGDSIGLTTLQGFANQLVFPVWSVSAVGHLPGPEALEEDVQQQAEIAAVLLIGLDRPGPPPTADALRATLYRTNPEGPGPRAPFGRPLAFRADGERESFDPGAVLSLPREAPGVLVYVDGRWTKPRRIESEGPP